MKFLNSSHHYLHIKRIILLGLMVLIGSKAALAQTDTTFWFAAPEVAFVGNPPCDRPILIRLTAYNQAASVTISQPANGGMPNQVINVPANSIKTVDLTNWIDNIETKPTDSALNYGLKLASNVPISAYYEEVSGGGVGFFPDPEIYNLKGQYALGKDFRIPAQNVLANDSIRFNPALLSSFNIVATEDNTNITITPSKNLFGHAANVPFTIKLNLGQTFAASASSPAALSHLNGSHVVSDKPIAITVSDDGPMYYTGGDDLGGDQILPTEYLGKEYIAVNSLLDIPGDIVFVIATEDNTKVFKDGVYLSTINAGETKQVPLNEDAAYINTSAPSSVWQLSGVGVQTGQIQLPRLNCTGSKSVSFIRSVEGSLLLNIIVPSGGENGFSINGNNNILTSSQFSVVPGTSGNWMYCRISLALGSYPMNSKIKIENTTSNFQMGVINGYTYRGANVSYFANFNSSTTVANITAQPNPACEGDDIQLATDSISGAQYLWQGPNGFSSTVFNPVLSNVSLADAGNYTLQVNSGGIGCNSSGNIQIDIHPIPVVNLGNDTTICTGSLITLQSNSNYPDALYSWSTGDATQTITVRDSGTYTLSITNLPDCKGTDEIHVALHDCNCTMQIPNAFSPNADGLNDVFEPMKGFVCPVENYLLRIYNRYGQLVFSSENPAIGWNGRYANKKADLGSYFYYITFKDIKTGTKQKFKGDLTLIR